MARDPLRGDWLARAVRPARVLLHARLRSTNTRASDLVESGRLTAPAIVVASVKTAGRGQHENAWWSDAGSLCATFLLSADPAMPVGQIPLRAGLAVARVIAGLLPETEVRVKWPNDVFAGDRKIAGLLCARGRGMDLIGIGVNVRTNLRRAPHEVRDRAASLSQFLRHPPRRDELLADLWRAVQEARSDASWPDDYRRRHLLHGRCVTVDSGDVLVRGTCLGVDEQGRLLIEHDGHTSALTSGTPAVTMFTALPQLLASCSCGKDPSTL
jgi:BirA family biotin operon repressor/biotin-[acetyl-CoA-carboxylase] ligase